MFLQSWDRIFIGQRQVEPDCYSFKSAHVTNVTLVSRGSVTFTARRLQCSGRKIVLTNEVKLSRLRGYLVWLRTLLSKFIQFVVVLLKILALFMRFYEACKYRLLYFHWRMYTCTRPIRPSPSCIFCCLHHPHSGLVPGYTRFRSI